MAFLSDSANARPFGTAAIASEYPSQCPLCHRNDMTQRVSAVIDQGTTITRGSASTVGFGTNGMFFAPVSVSNQSMSALAQRFNFPKYPRSLGGTYIMWSIFFSIVAAMTAGVSMQWVNQGMASPPLLFAVFLLVLLVAGFIMVRTNASRRVAQQDWVRRASEARAGYYCYRDDIAWLPGSTDAAQPETFAARFFAD